MEGTAFRSLTIASFSMELSFSAIISPVTAANLKTISLLLMVVLAALTVNDAVVLPGSRFKTSLPSVKAGSQTISSGELVPPSPIMPLNWAIFTKLII